MICDIWFGTTSRRLSTNADLVAGLLQSARYAWRAAWAAELPANSKWSFKFVKLWETTLTANETLKSRCQ